MREEQKDIKPGDWVRFYREGTLVIGVVAYVRDRRRYPRWEKEALTDKGSVDLSDIIEVRHAH